MTANIQHMTPTLMTAVICVKVIQRLQWTATVLSIW